MRYINSNNIPFVFKDNRLAKAISKRVIDNIQSNTHFDIIHSRTKPPHSLFYESLDEELIIPVKERFHDYRGYYITLYHELAHVVCSDKRLNITMKKVCEDEILAETTALIMTALSGIDSWRLCTNYILMWVYNRRLTAKRPNIKKKEQWDNIEMHCFRILWYFLTGKKKRVG
jgi:antirestriction protein ArdC